MKKLIFVFVCFSMFACAKSTKTNPTLAITYLAELKNITSEDNSVLYEFINQKLVENDVEIFEQENEFVKNIVGKVYPERKKRISFGTHYDVVNQENLGAIALILSLTKLCNAQNLQEVGLDFVFFDNHNCESDSLRFSGAKLYSQNQLNQDNKFFLIENILGTDFEIKIEENSYKNSYLIIEEILRIAYDLGINEFSSELRAEIKSEQVVLNENNISTVLLTNTHYSESKKDNEYIFNLLQELLLKVVR